MGTTKGKPRTKAKNTALAEAEAPATSKAKSVLRSSRSAAALEPHVFRFREAEFACDTDRRGFPTPRGASPTELVVDASNGFIPLWARGQTLRWRFQARSLLGFADPDLVKEKVRTLMGEALMLWGDFRPIAFSEQQHNWDFEVVVRKQDKCDLRGCVLARAFFPDAGRHELVVFPRMFEQVYSEQVETMAHEFGHVFGLRHFFAQVSERAWPSEIFGTHQPFSIMNYGHQSEMTDADREDLRVLYESAWSGSLTEINGTRIRLVKPYTAPVEEYADVGQEWSRAACVSVQRCAS